MDKAECNAPKDRAVRGPKDTSEVSGLRPYIDFGSLKIAPREGLQLRLDVDENAGQAVAVSLDYAGATLQVQAFAAPKSRGLWGELLNQLQEGMAAQGAKVTRAECVFGDSALAHVSAPNGVKQTLLLIGVDGPRWVLRGVVMGAGVRTHEVPEVLADIFREIVVERGDVAMPPGDLLPLRVPADVQQQVASQDDV